jgi:hypothetical protein
MFESTGPVASFEELPTELLLPSVSLEAKSRLRGIGLSLDQAQLDGRCAWYGHPSIAQAADVGPHAFIATFGFSVGTYTARNDDWLELTVEVGWRRPRLRSVEFDVGVACWCQDDHGTHYIVSRSEAVGDDTQLVAAFERSAAELISWWQAGPHDPNTVRAGVGLPNP